MPAQILSPHRLARQFGETHQAVGLGKVENVRRWPQRLPLHGIFRDQDARLRSHRCVYRVGRVALCDSLHIEQIRIHRRAVEQPSGGRMSIERIPPGYAGLGCGVILSLPSPSPLFYACPSQAQRAGRPNAQRGPAKLPVREFRLADIRHALLLR